MMVLALSYCAVVHWVLFFFFLTKRIFVFTSARELAFFYYYLLSLLFWLHWVFVAACGLPLVVASELLIAVASLVVACGL